MALMKCPECGREISDKAQSCPNCGYPILKKEDEEWQSWDSFTNNSETKELKQTPQQPPKKNNSSGGCLLVIVLIFIGWLFCKQVMDGTGGDSIEESYNVTEATTEATTEITTEESTEISVDEIKEIAEDVTWDELYRNPETWRDKYVKITVHVDEYETKLLGMVDAYICNVDGNMIYIMDYRDKKEPTIASGDNALIYGKGGGMATYKVKTQNEYGVTTDSEKTKYPQVNMYSAELQ